MQASSSADAGRRAAHLLARAEAHLACSAEAAKQRTQAAAEVHDCFKYGAPTGYFTSSIQ